MRSFVADPRRGALWSPANSPAHPKTDGRMPLGFNIRNKSLVCVDWYDLATHSTTVAAEGQLRSGKTVFEKIVFLRSLTIQSGSSRLADGTRISNKTRGRIHCRKPEKGEPDWERTIKYVKGNMHQIGRDSSINPFDQLFVKTESHAVEIAIKLAEIANEAPLTGTMPLAIQVAVNKMWRDSTTDGWQSMRVIATPHVLFAILRGLRGSALMPYFADSNADTLLELEEKLAGRPELKEQLKLILSMDHNIDEVEFEQSAGKCAGLYNRLLGGDYGGVIGSRNSLYDALSSLREGFNYDHLTDKARPIAEMLMWTWMTEDIDQGEGKQDFASPITPHIDISDEEGNEALQLNIPHLEALSNFSNRSRSVPTLRVDAVQSVMQRLRAGNADSRARSLATNIERSIGMRFVFKQPYDTDVQQYYSGLGMSDLDVESLHTLGVGQCFVLMPQQDAFPMQIYVTQAEWNANILSSDGARSSMLNRVPVFDNKEMRKRQRALLAMGKAPVTTLKSVA